MSMLQMVLKKFLNLAGVMAAFILESDGTLIEHATRGIDDIDAIGFPLAEAITASTAIATEMGDTALSMAFCEFGESFVLAIPLTGEKPLSEVTYLAIIAERDANIGRIRYELKKNKDLIISVL
ncbi:MAG: dynein regulation protein LC7 [Methanomicrobiaceae archaeon]|nr:dynein regulation protein LC7 [Methanomicrobiaceae archaeon]